MDNPSSDSAPQDDDHPMILGDPDLVLGDTHAYGTSNTNETSEDNEHSSRLLHRDNQLGMDTGGIDTGMQYATYRSTDNMENRFRAAQEGVMTTATNSDTRNEDVMEDGFENVLDPDLRNYSERPDFASSSTQIAGPSNYDPYQTAAYGTQSSVSPNPIFGQRQLNNHSAFGSAAAIGPTIDPGQNQHSSAPDINTHDGPGMYDRVGNYVHLDSQGQFCFHSTSGTQNPYGLPFRGSSGIDHGTGSGIDIGTPSGIDFGTSSAIRRGTLTDIDSGPSSGVGHGTHISSDSGSGSSRVQASRATRKWNYKRWAPPGYKLVLRCPVCDIHVLSQDYASVRYHLETHRPGKSKSVLTTAEEAFLAAWDSYSQAQQNDILGRETLYLTVDQLDRWKQHVNSFADGGNSWDGNWGTAKIQRTLPRFLDGTRPTPPKQPGNAWTK